ncbi:hypothetical protein OIU76_017846 [Salix suchowensis]|nr:hypothetical protein OIU76_017846 [Salix suchowensis]
MEEAKSKTKSPFKRGDPFLEEVRQELNYDKDLNSNLWLQLQKTKESNAELILAVKDLNEMLEQKSRETFYLSNKVRSYEKAISRSKTDDDEEQKALEELVKEHKDSKEMYLLEQKIMYLCSEIEIYRREKDELEIQMEQLELDYEILKQENHEMSYKLEQSQLQEQLKIQYECSPSFPNINELEAQVESLENELKIQSKGNFDSLTTIKQLETHIMSLEKELDQQAQEFDVDLEAVTSARVEQEQRAIQAEEALRKIKLKNANTAEKLQEEFRRLSVKMASTFDANEKVAMKALAEASELHMQKGQLEEMLQKANEELQSVKDDYESKLHALSKQMLMEFEDKSRQLEQQKKHDEECGGNFSHEIQGLKAELEMLSIENNGLSEQADQKENMSLELEQMKASTSLLQSEVRMLKAQCDDLKHSLFEDELEKEKLRKQLVQSKSELKKKEDALSSMEKKLKESNKCIAVSEGSKSITRNYKFVPVPYGSKEVTNLREKIKLLVVQIKLKETSLEASANSFSEKERNLQNKIEELEGRVEKLDQNCTSFCCNQPRKSSEDNIGITPNVYVIEDLRSRDEKPRSSTSGMSEENGNLKLPINSNHSSVSEYEPKTCSINNTDHNANEAG